MKITNETARLEDFEFWSGAKDHVFTRSELREIEFQFEMLYPEGMTDTQVNDLFWFDEEFLCECIGVDFENDYLNR